MLWELTLIATVGLGAGIALDASGRLPRRRFNSVGFLGLASAVWAASELLLVHATSPDQILWCRRLLFAGVCAIGPLMLCAALEVSSRRIRLFFRPLLLLTGGIEGALYSLLYTPWSAWFISGESGARAYGPGFYVHAAAAWAALATAILLLTLAAWRARGVGRIAALACLFGASTPVVLNAIFVLRGWPTHDPTPLAMGLGAIVVRWGVLDLLSAQFLAAHARSDLLDQLDSGVVVADAEGRILEANRTARQLLGDPFTLGGDLSAALAPFATDPGFTVREFPLLRRGAHVGRGAIVTDRRQERAAERRDDVEDRLEALSVLSRGLAHEINNPLAVVMGNAELLAVRLRSFHGVLEFEFADLLREIDEGAAKIAAIVGRMAPLASPRNPAAWTSEADVGQVTARAAELARVGMSADAVVVRGSSPATRALVRSSELLEILFHLIQNAVHASTAGTPVEVQIDPTDSLVQIRVLDRGHGLPRENAARVFEPFFTTNRPGRAGLGLSLCWELARQNGGTMEAMARDGGGAEFRVTLPRA